MLWQVQLGEGGLDACVTLGTGDMRKCINILQSTSMAFGTVDQKAVYTCTGSPQPQDMESILGWLMQVCKSPTRAPRTHQHGHGDMLVCGG